MTRFREFMKLQCEQEAAPPAGMGTPPANPDSATNKHHFDFLKRELDIDDESFEGAIQGGPQTLHEVPDFGWGFVVKPPVQAVVKPRDDGRYDVTILFSQVNKRKIFHPYKSGQQPVPYEHPVEDQTVVMEEEDLINCMTPPLEGMANAGVGAPPGGPGGF